MHRPHSVGTDQRHLGVHHSEYLWICMQNMLYLNAHGFRKCQGVHDDTLAFKSIRKVITLLDFRYALIVMWG